MSSARRIYKLITAAGLQEFVALLEDADLEDWLLISSGRDNGRWWAILTKVKLIP